MIIMDISTFAIVHSPSSDYIEIQYLLNDKGEIKIKREHIDMLIGGLMSLGRCASESEPLFPD